MTADDAEKWASALTVLLSPRWAFYAEKMPGEYRIVGGLPTTSHSQAVVDLRTKQDVTCFIEATGVV